LLQLVRALYTRRLRELVAVLPSDLTAETPCVAASEKMTGPVRGVHTELTAQHRTGNFGDPGLSADLRPFSFAGVMASAADWQLPREDRDHRSA
jgi:hypothetical protein